MQDLLSQDASNGLVLRLAFDHFRLRVERGLHVCGNHAMTFNKRLVELLYHGRVLRRN